MAIETDRDAHRSKHLKYGRMTMLQEDLKLRRIKLQQTRRKK